MKLEKIERGINEPMKVILCSEIRTRERLKKSLGQKKRNAENTPEGAEARHLDVMKSPSEHVELEKQI